MKVKKVEGKLKGRKREVKVKVKKVEGKLKGR